MELNVESLVAQNDVVVGVEVFTTFEAAAWVLTCSTRDGAIFGMEHNVLGEEVLSTCPVVGHTVLCVKTRLCIDGMLHPETITVGFVQVAELVAEVVGCGIPTTAPEHIVHVGIDESKIKFFDCGDEFTSIYAPSRVLTPIEHNGLCHFDLRVSDNGELIQQGNLLKRQFGRFLNDEQGVQHNIGRTMGNLSTCQELAWLGLLIAVLTNTMVQRIVLSVPSYLSPKGSRRIPARLFTIKVKPETALGIGYPVSDSRIPEPGCSRVVTLSVGLRAIMRDVPHVNFCTFTPDKGPEVSLKCCNILITQVSGNL